MLLGLGFKVGISKLPVGEYIYAKEIGKQEPQIKAASTPPPGRWSINLPARVTMIIRREKSSYGSYTVRPNQKYAVRKIVLG